MRPKSGRQSDLIKSVPIVFVCITDGCNSRCITCDIWRAPRKNISMGIVDSLAQEFKVLGVEIVAISGGEAMQHPEWPQIASRFREAGARVLLFTNGLYLRKEIDKVADAVDSVVVSLDGADSDTYREIRGVNAFPLVLEGMKSLKDAKIKFGTRTTIQRRNFRQMGKIVDVAMECGAEQASFLTVDTSNTGAFGREGFLTADKAAEGKMSDISLTREDLPEFSKVVEALIKSHASHFKSGKIVESPRKIRGFVDYFSAANGLKPFIAPSCAAPEVSVVVEVDGTIRPCFFLPSGAKLGGDGDSMSLQRALNTAGMRSLRREFRAGRRTECERCVCTVEASSQ